MTRFLLSISIGPVQEFIAAARRTADLYAGSHLLLKVVGAAAATFESSERVFPVSTEAGGANKILAIVEGGPAERAEKAKAAAQAALKEAWAEVWQKLQESGQADLIDKERAEAQLADFLEIYSAWVPLNEGAEGYKEARARVEQLLAGRKALRDFKPLPADDAGLPKSPLDPSRASVVKLEGQQLPKKAANTPLRLKGNEVLDAVSVLKRVMRMEGEGDWGQVLSTRKLAERAIRPDAQGRADDDYVPPYPYYAVLIADGDKMGKLLSAHDNAQAHRSISHKLDDFAARAKEIVKKHKGQPVFVGGDDVMALLPVTRVVNCADELAKAFEAALKAFAKEDNLPESSEVKATLSVGVAIVHYLEPLSVSLGHARAAEKHAKVTRNALSVALHTRGGAPMTVRQGWDNQGLYGTLPLAHWLKVAVDGGISRGFPYELRELAQEWPLDEEDKEKKRVSFPTELKAEVERIWKKKRERETGDTRVLPKFPDFKTREDLVNFAQILTLARFLSGQALVTGMASQAEGEKRE